MPARAQSGGKRREKSSPEEGKNKGEVVLNFICVVALWLNVL